MVALNAFWRHTPPAAIQLRRIALALGIKMPDPSPNLSHSAKPEDALQQALAAGVPVLDTLPDDPILKFLD